MCIPAHHKRPIEEVRNFDGLNESVPNAPVHATITSLSPTIYFDGTITDSTLHLRVVGFSEQRKLTYFEAKTPTCLINCEIKPS